MSLNESIVEDIALGWFGELGYAVGHGPHLAPGEPAAERDSFGDVVLVGRLRAAIARLNPGIPADAQEEALRKVLRVGTPSLAQTNRAFHKMLRDGVDVEYPRPDGSIKGDKVRLIDFSAVEANDWLAVNQFFLEQTAYIARKMNAIQEGPRTLLDNTMLMHCSSMMAGAKHDNDQLPVILLGCGGILWIACRFMI